MVRQIDDDYLNRLLEEHMLLAATHHYGSLQNIYYKDHRTLNYTHTALFVLYLHTCDVKMRFRNSIQEPPIPRYNHNTAPHCNTYICVDRHAITIQHIRNITYTDILLT
uniref:Uncharacterized protein n=1 Tax=Glossina austeni TaxID=7395 RepID=A0A1A9V217_GLOAU